MGDMIMKEVPETWWHRLLAVLALGAWLSGTGLAAFIAWDASKEAVYSYNWHANTGSLKTPIDCTPALHPETGQASFYCGKFHTTTSAVDDMIATGFITNVAQIPSPRSEYSDGRVLESINRKYPLKYQWERIFSPSRGLKYGAYAIGASMAMLAILGMAWKLIFFIAYGANHRIVR